MKNILQRNNQKRYKKIQHKHISHYSLKQSSEESREGRVDVGGKNEHIYLKLKKENNIRTMVLRIYLEVIIYLIEAFKKVLNHQKEAIWPSNDWANFSKMN